MAFTLGMSPWFAGVGALLTVTSVIAVHGVMCGTATADFGGTKNTGIVVGIVDGCVYLGSGIQALVIGELAPTGADAKDPSNWTAWPLFLVPFAVLGVFFAVRIWNAIPTRHSPAPAEPTPAEHPVTAS